MSIIFFYLVYFLFYAFNWTLCCFCLLYFPTRGQYKILVTVLFYFWLIGHHIAKKIKKTIINIIFVKPEFEINIICFYNLALGMCFCNTLCAGVGKSTILV